MDEVSLLRLVVISFILKNDKSRVPTNVLPDLREIQKSVIHILTILEDADDTHFQKLWLKKMKDFVSDAEDALDDLSFLILFPKVTKSNPSFTHFPFLQNLINFYISFDLKYLNASFQNILNEGLLFTLKHNISHHRILPYIDFDRVTYSVLHNLGFWRQPDASKIVNLLTCTPHQPLLTVVPIVGMSGLGKTALPKSVCQQLMALHLFDVKMWVRVSEQCDEVKLLGQMLRSLNATVGVLSLINKQAILKQLDKELAGKRFLLVLDDVWNDVSRWWDHFKARLLKFCTDNGSVVVVTTCSEQVASIVETSSRHRHKVEFLSDDECWFILKERAFRNVTPQVQSDLEDIGREIASECRGVPLAAKVLGGTLGFTKDKAAWLRIRDSLFSKAWSNEGNLESVLKLCFDHLPLPLKPCLAFCSIFPKGFSIIKEDLVRLWVAERYANSYDKGNKYFNALLENSFFQDAESDVGGNVIKCKMHNLVHDLALSSLEKSKMLIHHLYADHQSLTTSKPYPNKKTEYLTTVILNDAPFRSFWNLKRLRTLYLNDVDMENVPTSINKLKYLSYLHVSNTKTRPLPKSITQIYLLQILVLSNCSFELPLLGVLPLLTFLKISHMERVKCIGNESYEGNSSQRELRLFPSLKSFSMSWMENLIEWSPPSHGNEVVIFPLLENLSIQYCPKLAGFPMRGLSELVKLEIIDCEEFRFTRDNYKSFSFPSIISLSFEGCPKLTHLRNWLLPRKRYARIKSYEEIRVRRCEWLSFLSVDLGMQRSLVSLQIYCCKVLGFFSEDILCKLTQLRKLSIGAFSEKLDDFCYLNKIKDLTRLEELEIWGSDVYGRKMSALPSQIQHLASLRSLKIKGFTTMKALPKWLGDLQRLETISLNHCWHLEPQSTAEIIQHLSNVSHVSVYDCHALEEHKSQWTKKFKPFSLVIR